MSDTMIGVIGGSGVYEIDGLQDATWITVETPWGAPSDQILTWHVGWGENGVFAAPRSWACAYAKLNSLPREHRRRSSASV